MSGSELAILVLGEASSRDSGIDVILDEVVVGDHQAHGLSKVGVKGEQTANAEQFRGC